MYDFWAENIYISKRPNIMKKNKPEKGKMRKNVKIPGRYLFYRGLLSNYRYLWRETEKTTFKLTGSKTVYDTLFILPWIKVPTKTNLFSPKNFKIERFVAKEWASYW